MLKYVPTLKLYNVSTATENTLSQGDVLYQSAVSEIEHYSITPRVLSAKTFLAKDATIEGLWKSLKYEGSYLYKWQTAKELKENIPLWLEWYNERRPHQVLGYKTPSEVYGSGFMDKSCNLPTIPLPQQLQQDLFL